MPKALKFSQSEVAQPRGIGGMEVAVMLPPDMMTYPGKAEIRVIYGEDMVLGCMVAFLAEYEKMSRDGPSKDSFWLMPDEGLRSNATVRAIILV